MDEENIPASWSQLIENYRKNKTLQSRTCRIYSRDPQQPPKNTKARCPCGRLIRRHSFDGASVESNTLIKNNAWTPPLEFMDLSHSKNVPINVFGTLSPSGCKFLRVDNRFDPNPLQQLGQLYQLILQDCGGKEKKPGLIISVYGGAKYFVLTERLEKEVMRGIISAATKADAWILTAGINNGVSKLVGEGMSHYRLLHDYPNKVKCIGLTMWGTISESARLELKDATDGYNKGLIYRQIPDDQQEDNDGIEPNHTHCILFDSGRLKEYLSDKHRDNFVITARNDKSDNDHMCYAVTIMVEGGLNSLEVLENDIHDLRPIVLIQDSGRMADVIASLLELTSNAERNQKRNPTDVEIRNAFDTYFPNSTEVDAVSTCNRIKIILDTKQRYLLNVFRSDRDTNVAETIFKAIFAGIAPHSRCHPVDILAPYVANKIGKKSTNVTDQGREVQEDSRHHQDRLVKLALEWDFIDGAAPILKKWQDEMVQKLQLTEEDVNRENDLFQKSLENNRPTFVDYFLSVGFDPRKLLKAKHGSKQSWDIWKLYDNSRECMTESHRERVSALFGRKLPRSIEDLQEKLHEFVGSFVGMIDTQPNENFRERICIDFCTCMMCCRKSKQIPLNHEFEMDTHQNHDHIDDSMNTQKDYSKQQILRDLFLWAVFMDMPKMAKVLLVHVRSRICAALIASAVFKQYAKSTATVYLKEKLSAQALEFETYAARSIDQCYEHNERTACELLLRQVPLFGHVTCMQVAISSESGKLLETACFDQALNHVWYNRLALSNHRVASKPRLLFSCALFGLPAPVFVEYREKETRRSIAGKNVEYEYVDNCPLLQSLSRTLILDSLSPHGIDYYANKKSSEKWSCTKYWRRFIYFHESPMIKMFYHFVSYIFFLLVFSYMMLYHFDPVTTVTVHWTEIYVIITVTTMLCEEVRELLHEYNTRMLERWTSPESSVGARLANAFSILPYLLFYLGLGFRYGSGDNDDLLTTARIILALDLEIWYLRSLKFVIALKFLGPKLFMLKNMLRDLFAFVYMIFVAIAAYGVVSRALILYKQVPFTGRGIFHDIFYAPYWFIHGEISDRELLDDRLQNETSSVVAEATATHVLLAFHMLFINILLLNLLIAVFADTIGKVQKNTEFYWRYQRYSFVREYFQRPFLAYPPLIIIPHLILLSLAIINKCCPKLGKNQVDDVNKKSISERWIRLFKIIPKRGELLEEYWDLFENAATHSYARSILKKYKKRSILNTDDSLYGKTTTLDTDELNTLKSTFTQAQENLDKNMLRLEKRLDQMTISMQWMMDAISRVKMNDPNKPKPPLQLPTPTSDVIDATTITSSSH